MPESKSSKVVLQVRLLVYRSDGAIEDWTHHEHGGFLSITSEASLAVEIVKNCENRIRLLKTAVEGRKHIEAELVRTMVDDLLSDLGDGEQVSSFIRMSADLFHDAELLPPLPTEGHEPSLKVVRTKSRQRSAHLSSSVS
ncbi:MAG: hypothetical protein HOP00_05485 [Nitrospira sp.]|nr:hypothetical protein [Nitrospira sp.]